MPAKVATDTLMRAPALICPATGLSLRRVPIGEAEGIAGPLHSRDGSPFGRTQQVWLRTDGRAAYPDVSDVPILLAPEVLSDPAPSFDLLDSRWGEAYDEMDFYNASAADVSQSVSTVSAQLLSMRDQPVWSAGWIDAAYDSTAQLEALQYLGPPVGQVVLQLGGKGVQAAKLLVAGAADAWLVTPMLSEALYGLELAKALGVSGHFNVVVGIAEQIPIAAETFSAIYAGGCLHHMATKHAAPEIFRVLKPCGRFAAVEPWQTALHKYGTRLVGKREANSYCRPLTSETLAPVYQTFRTLEVRHHGPILRYVALAAQKLTGRSITAAAGLRMTEIEDRLPLPDHLGGSVAVLAERSGT